MQRSWKGASAAARAVIASVGAWLALEPIGASANPLTVALSEQPGIVLGTNKSLGAGSVVAWIRTNKRGAQTAAGISFDEAALRKLGGKPKEIVLTLPSTPESAMRTVVIYWNPHGHPPSHVYDVPHFDFHFYTIDEATRMGIAPTGPAAVATPSPNLYPAGFITDGATIPMMGKHYVFGREPEFTGGRFTATPIYGYWDGHLAFVESMVTLAYLQSHPSLSRPLPQPARFELRGAYPTRWAVNYVASAHRYDVTFTNLMTHDASAPLASQATGSHMVATRAHLAR